MSPPIGGSLKSGRFTVSWESGSFDQVEDMDTLCFCVVNLVINAINEGKFDLHPEANGIVITWSEKYTTPAQFAYTLDLTLYTTGVGDIKMYQLDVTESGENHLLELVPYANPFRIGPRN